MISSRRVRLILWLLIASGLIVRLAFAFYFQQFYYGRMIFSWSDTESFLQPILNLVQHGVYQGDLYLEDSRYYRMPTYPVILGLFYFALGEHFEHGVALFQCLLDAASIYLVFRIYSRIGGSDLGGLLAAALYASYPFVLVWLPILQAEIVALFLFWLTLYLVVDAPPRPALVFLQGLVCGLLLMSRQISGLVLLIPLVGVLTAGDLRQKCWRSILLGCGFLALMGPWVIRNYLHSGELIVLMAETAGVRGHGADVSGFTRFANLFDENITPALLEVAHEGTLTLDRHPEFLAAHREEIAAAAALAHDCGDSFVYRRQPTAITEPPYSGCNREVQQAFDALAARFWQEVPFLEAISTRLDALKKVFWKRTLVQGDKATTAVTIQQLLFAYRSVLLFCGAIAAILLLRGRHTGIILAMLAVAGGYYAYVSLVIVHVEMRYLLPADLMVSLFAAVGLARIVSLRAVSLRAQAPKPVRSSAA